MQAIKWGLPYIAKYKFRMTFGFLVNVVCTLLTLVVPFYTGLIVVDVIEEGRTYLLPTYLGIMIGVTLGRSIARYGFLILFEDTSQKVLFALRRDLYHKLHIQNFAWFDKNKVGDIMARMTGDLEAIRVFVAADIWSIPETVLIYISAIVVIGIINVPLTVALILLTPIAVLTALRQAKEIRPAFRNIREQFSHLNSVCAENIGGNRVVKAFTKEAYEIEKFTEANQAFYDSNTQAAKVRVKYMPIMETLAGSLPFILLLMGGLLVIWEQIYLWQMVTISGYLWMLNHPMRMLGFFVNNMQNFATSLEKIHEMMKEKVRIKDAEGAEAAPLQGSVEFRNVRFSYNRHEPEPYTLKGISFKAEKGQTIGIVGGTGSGKTSLVYLISRFYDVLDGEILVDGKNVKEFPLEVLRRDIAYAMQDVFLYSDTVEGNVAYGVPEAPMEAVYDAAEVADADGFVREMSEGYDTIVGERGVGLSGGQKQRLSLARAIATNPAILVLDDVTSAVDMETEQRIQEALGVKLAGRTTFIVAHRLSSVKDADQILVLAGGQITERGTHSELLALGGYYAQLFEEQRGAQ